MSNMSFFLTTDQCRRYQKTVTRRDGWDNIKCGEIVQQIVKGQGLKAGERVDPIHNIQIIGSRKERLDTIVTQPEYGRQEMILEGFPGRDPADFMEMYCTHNKKKPTDLINRIEFRYYLPIGDGKLLKVPKEIANCASCHGALTIMPNGWILLHDGTMICNSFDRWCEKQPDQEDALEYENFLHTHLRESLQPYISWLPIDCQIETWLSDTFRFEIGGEDVG